MGHDPLCGLAKPVQGPQLSGPSRQVLLRDAQGVSEANQDASYTGMPSTYGAKKAARSFWSALYRMQVCKGQLKLKKQFKKALLSPLHAS